LKAVERLSPSKDSSASSLRVLEMIIGPVRSRDFLLVIVDCSGPFQ
jgi:hypothetical protein